MALALWGVRYAELTEAATYKVFMTVYNDILRSHWNAGGEETELSFLASPSNQTTSLVCLRIVAPCKQ